MAVANTMSAHSISEFLSDRTFMSTIRFSQVDGSKADTVMSPSGGKALLLPSNGKACRKLQYVSGNSGFSSNTFIVSLLNPVAACDADSNQCYPAGGSK